MDASLALGRKGEKVGLFKILISQQICTYIDLTFFSRAPVKQLAAEIAITNSGFVLNDPTLS